MLVYKIIILVLIVCICKLYSKYHYYKTEYYDQKDMYLYYKSKLSMIEYHYRKYKEGCNPFTVLRDLGNIIQGYYLKLGAGLDKTNAEDNSKSDKEEWYNSIWKGNRNVL